jgi:hypothetical protein
MKQMTGWRSGFIVAFLLSHSLKPLWGFFMRHKKMDLSVKIPLFTGILVVVVLLYMIFAAGPSVEMIEKKDTIQPEAF